MWTVTAAHVEPGSAVPPRWESARGQRELCCAERLTRVHVSASQPRSTELFVRRFPPPQQPESHQLGTDSRCPAPRPTRAKQGTGLLKSPAGVHSLSSQHTHRQGHICKACRAPDPARRVNTLARSGQRCNQAGASLLKGRSPTGFREAWNYLSVTKGECEPAEAEGSPGTVDPSRAQQLTLSARPPPAHGKQHKDTPTAFWGDFGSHHPWGLSVLSGHTPLPSTSPLPPRSVSLGHIC